MPAPRSVAKAELASRLARARVASIAGLTDAHDACIVGSVSAPRALFSPGRGVACVAYWFRDDMGHDEHRELPFAIVDASGDALITPRNAVLWVAAHEGEGFHRSVVGASYLRNHGDPGWYREGTIEVGQRIYVIGACTRELVPRPGGELLYRERAVSRLHFLDRDETPLVLADEVAMNTIKRGEDAVSGVRHSDTT